MKKVLFLISVVFLIASCNQSQSLFQEDSEEWEVFGDAKWNFSNNELLGEISDGNSFVMTKKIYEDFVLELQFKPDSTINSGVFIRCTKKEINPTDCFELNIADLHPIQEYRTGAIVTKGPPLIHVETLNQWNTYKIIAEKSRIQVWVNNELTADATYENLPEGFIALQAMGKGQIRFRDINLKTTK